MFKKMFTRFKEIKDKKIDVGILEIPEHQLEEFEDVTRVGIDVKINVKHPEMPPVLNMLYTDPQLTAIVCPKCGYPLAWTYGADGEGDLHAECCGKCYGAYPEYYILAYIDDKE